MKNKVLLIGWDAADWQIIWPLIAKGEMPALKKLIEKGVYGNMSTMNPPYSPMLWSTVATGKTPDKHGVLGFIELMPDHSGVRPVTVNSRKSKAIWNILHHEGYRSNIVGWWPSFPAEPINGNIVSDKFQKLNKNLKAKNQIAEGVLYPPALGRDIADLRMFPQEITEAHILPFMPKASEIDQEKDKSLETFSKIMAENVSVHAAATNLIRTTEWDFMAVYYDLIDHFCHAFMKFHPPKQDPIPDKSFDIYKDAVKGAYRFQDMMLGRTMELVDDDTTVIIMSDHGFESGHRRILKMPKYPAAPALEHRQFGMFVASGPNIKKNEKVFGLGLVDIAPTLLHMFNLPVGKDMDGNVALDIFETPTKPSYIDSWESIKGDFGQHKNSHEIDQLSDNDTMQQLIELGYIDSPDERIEIAILKTKCDLKHNLARVYLGKKDYANSKAILRKLISSKYPKYDGKDEEKNKKRPYPFVIGESMIDTIPFYLDLLSISLVEQDFDSAENYLKDIISRDKKLEVNTLTAEIQILLGRGKVQKALEKLEAIKHKTSNSEIWYQIGKIHQRIDNIKQAKEAYETAISIENDKAKFHQALAEVLIQIGNYEEAAEYALTSIELVKYFPKAHYVLGQALEQLGDLENAKKAFETAISLTPKSHYRADIAIENINNKIEFNKAKLQDKNESTYKKDQIVIVSGLPRSGTSLMMQMLDKGGLDILTDNDRKPDQSNPKGYYEYNPVMSIHRDNSWIPLAQNKGVKVVAPLLKFLDPKYRYKIIFMTRDLNEVVKSQQKMIGKDTNTLPLALFEAYNKQLETVNRWKNKEPGVELIYIDYQEPLNDAPEVAKKIASFIGLPLDTANMVTCVDQSLYRNKAKHIAN
jgi:predicted AlkP superfamily phosphohydrolase/phosphomutase/predicted negative regulator of RcsB-dependent stress response